jgi:hypothetical protein
MPRWSGAERRNRQAGQGTKRADTEEMTGDHLGNTEPMRFPPGFFKVLNLQGNNGFVPQI